MPDAPAVAREVFLNNFVRNWGHTFIYEHETLALIMLNAGFRVLRGLDINAFPHEAQLGLKNEARLPPGFLALETMVVKADQAPAADEPS